MNQAQYLRSGISIEYFGIIAIVMQIVRLSSVKAYKLSSRIGENSAIQILYFIMTICCIILVFTSNSMLTILTIIFICGSGAIISPIVLDVENKSIVTTDRATLLSIFAMFGDLTSAGVNVIVGKAADISAPSAFLICVIMCACANALLFVYKKVNMKSDTRSFHTIDKSNKIR